MPWQKNRCFCSGIAEYAMITWKRERVRNLFEDFADALVSVLVANDGQPYDQVEFFRQLAATGIVTDPGDDEKRFKRWDSYSNRIREFGLGFKRDERISGASSHSRWRASEIAKDYASGSIGYRDFMALQMMRWQFPVPQMPLGDYAGEIAAGFVVRPLALTLDALGELRKRGEESHLTVSEFSQLQRVDGTATLDDVIDDVLDVRAGRASGAWLPDMTSWDILLNECAETRYIMQVAEPERVVVPNWSRWREAKALDAGIPAKPYHDLSSVEEFNEWFGTSPSASALSIVARPPDVVAIDTGPDAQWDGATSALTGPVGVVGGLPPGTPVVLRGAGSDGSNLYQVESEPEPDAAGVLVRLAKTGHSLSGNPIQI
jgi:hypothetical protein